MTNEEKNARQREYRANNNNSSTSKYEKTPNGFLMRLYRNMQSRINGVQKAKHHLYKGKYLLPRCEFYEWSKPNESFKCLFKDWEASNYSRKLTPSVDRVDSTKGYTVENMEWVTHSENSRRGTISKCLMYNYKIPCKI
tara:strand:+ start:14046 stop:14462 length:417 start_codon:yes stop_codon:yes gene_type:complete